VGGTLPEAGPVTPKLVSEGRSLRVCIAWEKGWSLGTRKTQKILHNIQRDILWVKDCLSEERRDEKSLYVFN